MSRACVLCGGDRVEDALVVYDRVVPRREDFRLRRCAACTLLSLTPVPDEPGEAYPDDYPSHAPAADSAGERRPSRLARRRLSPPREGARMLDVGCGSGRLLARYRALGWDVRGIEPSEAAAKVCSERGLPVECTSLEDAVLPARHFDRILVHHVIEHVRGPVDALRQLKAALSPGGFAVVVTPNAGGLGFRLYGSCWYAVDAPRHLHLFDAHTLALLAARAGLEVERMRSVSSPRVLANSRHYLTSQGPVLPEGLAARTAAIERSKQEDPGIASFRRAIRPVAWVASRLGFGETLHAHLALPGETA